MDLCFKPPYTTISISNIERVICLSIQIINKKKEKYFIYNSIEPVESSFSMHISYDSLLAKKTPAGDYSQENRDPWV